MPGIDYTALRCSHYDRRGTGTGRLPRSAARRGNRLRGHCPFGCGNSPRDFVANLTVRRYRCFSCGRHGNQLELWASIQGQPLHPAAPISASG